MEGMNFSLWRCEVVIGDFFANYLVMLLFLVYFCNQNNIIMTQVAFTVRTDEEIKKKVESLCEDFGMSMNTLLNVFLRAVARKKKIPFEIESDKDEVLENGRNAFLAMRKIAAENGLSGMTLEEINEEISHAREGK